MNRQELHSFYVNLKGGYSEDKDSSCTHCSTSRNGFINPHLIPDNLKMSINFVTMWINHHQNLDSQKAVKTAEDVITNCFNGDNDV